MSENWTPDQRKQWDDLCSMPIMAAALTELARRTKKLPIPIVPGYDALVIAAAEHHRSVGHQEIFDHIAEMRVKKDKPVSMPEPFTPAARGEKPKPTEQ